MQPPPSRWVKAIGIFFISLVIFIPFTLSRAQMSPTPSQIPPPVKDQIKKKFQPKPWWCSLFGKAGADIIISDISISENQINYTLTNMGKALAAGNFLTQFCRAASNEEGYSSSECMDWASSLTSAYPSTSQTVNQNPWIIMGAGGGGTSLIEAQIPGCGSKQFQAGYDLPVSPPVLGHVDYYWNGLAGVAETNTTNNSLLYSPQ